MSSKDPSLNLDKHDTQIIGIAGKNNFPKYRKLMSSFEIPSILIGDGDITEVRGNEVAKIFESPTVITKDGIKGNNPDVFVLGEGDLEDFMKAIDNDAYEETRSNVGRNYGRAASKPVIAYVFFKRVGSATPQKITVVEDLIRKIIAR